jgi:hypothetical protein
MLKEEKPILLDAWRSSVGRQRWLEIEIAQPRCLAQRKK